MANEASTEKWEGKVTVKISGCSANQIWPLVADFFNLHKYLPMDTCYGIEGTSDQPGCIRYCAKAASSGDGSGEMVTKWAHEKLLAVDPIKRSLSYEVLDNSFGLSQQNATMEVLPCEATEGSCCEFVWSFSGNPIEGCSSDDMFSMYKSSAQAMAKAMEEVIKAKDQ